MLHHRHPRVQGCNTRADVTATRVHIHNIWADMTGMDFDQLRYYQSKLAFEMDSADVVAALTAGREPITIVDGRAPAAWERERIPGAINLWHRELCANRTRGLDPARIYVCYCDGIGCNASTKTALKLLSLGFQVRELIGGLDWWVRDGHATEGTGARPGTVPGCGCQGV